MDLRLLDAVSWRGSPMAGERTHALLAALATTPSEGVGEERLVDEIWGDDVPANPVKALQVVVSRARAATSADAIVRTPHGYRLGAVDSDVVRLRRCAAEAHDAERRGDWTAAVDAARAVVDQQIADAGDGDLGALRAGARATRTLARALLGRALSALGEHEAALGVLDDAAPDEPTLLALLRSEAAVRGVPVALERYDRVRRQYADRLGVDPGPELQRLHAELLARDHPVREGLRYDASRLIGRADDVVALAAMTRSSRLVSIVGPGGLGKTRLAHLLGRLAEQPTVHFVELVGVTSPDGVAAEVGDALGVRDSYATRANETVRRTDLLTRIVDRIGTTPSLLVLDNCEHVVGAVADLVALLLARTPRLTVVTTTRAPLGLAAERVYLLPQLGTDDAVELFRERATAARAGVRLDDDEVRALVERLDGLPLAVELAAARVRVMSVAEIARRLDDRFTLLRGGSRDAPERHQTLLAVIDWSWNLLPDDERRALRRLSVFRDGFAADGAAAVVGDRDALDLVERLVEQSLVTVHEGDQVRYRLLETVREFGRLRLQEAGERDDAARDLHGWATGVAGALAPGLFTRDQIAVMRAVRAEEGNLVDVLRRTLADRDAESVVLLSAALMGLWSLEGAHLKVVALAGPVEEVLHGAALPDELGPVLRAVLGAVVINSMIFSNEASRLALGRLRELGPGDEPRIAGMIRALLMTGGEDDPVVMEALCEDADPYVARMALQWACQIYENAGELDLARDRGERALALWDDDDGPWGPALTTAQLASLALSVGDIDEAQRLAAAALPTLVALGADEDAGQTRAVFAIAALRAGRPDEAERILEEIAAAGGGQSVLGGAISVLCGRAEVALARGQVAEGLASYRAGIAALEHRSFPGPALPAGFSPWVMFPTAAALCAHIRHGERVDAAPLHERLTGTTLDALDVASPFFDYPVVGSVLYALGLWELTRPEGPGAQAIALLVSAERFSYNRMLPSLDWAHAEQRAEELLPGALAAARAALGDRRGTDLRDDVRRLCAELVDQPGRAQREPA